MAKEMITIPELKGLVQKLFNHPELRDDFVHLTDEQTEKLRTLNRKGRREYYKKHKRQFHGLKWTDISFTDQNKGRFANV